MWRKDFLCTGCISKKTLKILTYVFNWLYLTQSLTSFSSIDHLLCAYAWFLDSISYDIDDILSIDPSSNVFVFGDFNIYHKDWLNYSDGTDRPAKLCYSLSFSNVLTQMIGLSYLNPRLWFSQSCSFGFIFSSDTSICSTMAFPSLGNSDHVAVSISIDFLLNSQWNALFHCIAFDYSCADWDGIFDHLRDTPWENIFKLSSC